MAKLFSQHYKKWCFAFMFGLLIILTLTGCNGKKINCDYIEFVFRENDIRFNKEEHIINEHSLFTFEYPQCFRLIDINNIPFVELDLGVTEVEFTRRGVGDLEMLPIMSSISVQVEKPATWRSINATDAIEKALSFHETDPNFKIIERKPILVDRVSAECVVYSISRLVSDSDSPIHNRLVRHVAFDYEGFVWQIGMGCFEEEIEETEPYFNHLIETFEILD